MIEVTSDITIPSEELTITASRSSGPGGQNVNKVNTKVTLSFDVGQSPSLNDEQKSLIFNRLATRINKEGQLRISSQSSRSQWTNRETVLIRFADLIREALKTRPPRKRTRVSQQAKRKRLENKKHRALIKKTRSQPDMRYE